MFLEHEPELLAGLERTKVNAVQSLSEPGVDIERHGAVGDARDGALIQGHGMLHEALEIAC